MDASDAGMVECENGHIFCEDHVIGRPEESDDNAIHAANCPICSMQVLTTDDHLLYLVKITGKSEKTTLSEINERFATYDEFANFLRGK